MASFGGEPDAALNLTQLTHPLRKLSMYDLLHVRRLPILVVLIAVLLRAATTDATVVRIVTSLGPIDLRLYEGHAPLTVANFLNYTNSNRYDGTFIHRSIPGFVIQGGGYIYDVDSNMAPHIETFDQVMNEPGISNLRGTIAMAKLPPPPDGPPHGGPDSATSEWFLNLTDNSGPPPALDTQNGGFTVFGRIVFTGTSVMDAIAALPRQDLDGPFSETFDTVPLREGMTLADRFVYVTDVFVRTSIPAADYNFDTQVTVADYEVWKSTFGSTINASADGDGNGIVDAKDFVIWRNAFVAAGGSVVGIEIVPEASAVVLSFLAAGGLVCVRRRVA